MHIESLETSSPEACDMMGWSLTSFPRLTTIFQYSKIFEFRALCLCPSDPIQNIAVTCTVIKIQTLGSPKRSLASPPTADLKALPLCLRIYPPDQHLCGAYLALWICESLKFVTSAPFVKTMHYLRYMDIVDLCCIRSPLRLVSILFVCSLSFWKLTLFEKFLRLRLLFALYDYSRDPKCSTVD